VCLFSDDIGQRVHVTCAGGLVCVPQIHGGFESTDVCVPPSGIRFHGEPCDDLAACDTDLSCVERGAFKLCLSGEGADCSTSSDCASHLCPFPSRRCSINECEAVGEQCEGSELFCEGGDCGRTCGLLAERGEECVVNLDPGCQYERRCDDTLVCEARVADGVATASCVPIDNRLPGEPCDSAADCASSTCSEQTCG
jgi:hypothetical protein